LAGRNDTSVRVVSGDSRLQWWRRAALAVLWAEFGAQRGWAVASVAAGAIGLALLGVVPGGVVAPCLFVLATIGAGVACARAARHQASRPAAPDAERRLERDSGLPHRPFAVLQDRPASLAGEAGVWALHRARAEAALAALRLRAPAPGLAARDPTALRVLALLLLVAGLVTAGGDALPRLRRAFLPSFGGAQAVPVTLQAWVEPPSYTGMAPIFLPKAGGSVEVPSGSTLNISLTGGRFKPHLTGAAADGSFHALGGESWQATGILRQTGVLRVTRWFGQLAQWDIGVLANDPPAVNWAGPPGPAGKSLELALPWHVSQRWGVAALHARMVPEGHPDLPPIDLPIPLPGTPKDATGTMRSDLSANPLAGVKMDGTLTARDVSGQTGTSVAAHFTLPAREFHNGLARAIIDLRRRLALRDERPLEAAADLDALSMSPGGFAGHSGLYLNLVAVAALLREDASTAGIADAQARLWIVALALDGGLPEPSEAALERAKNDLRQALRERAEGRKNESEVDRQIRKLADALAQRLADIAQKAVRDGKMPPLGAHAQHFHVPTLDRLMKEMQEAEKKGDTKTVQQKLAEIENLLNKLQTAKVLTPQQAQEAEKAAKKGKQQTGAVQDMVQREGKLMDNGQHRAPRPSAMAPQYNPEGMEPPPDPDQLEANEEARGADVKTQRALSRALDAVKGAFGASGGKVPAAMNDATHDMADAAQALTAGQEIAARQAQAKAIADLQKGGKSMSQQMAANAQMAIVPGGGQPGQDGDDMSMDPGGQDEDGQRDPLGRPLQQGTGGKTADDGSVKVPDQMEQGLRSRAIQEELRRREADKARKREELDYIDRLLKPF
jgi:uncharacterized protein (TIGR02302 family)